MIYAFISSPVKGLREIREQIHKIKLGDDRSIYVDEVDHPRDKPEPWFDTIDDLFQCIHEAPEFIVLLATPKHGTPLPVAHLAAHTSYWEAELFYALLLLKETRVFEVDGFNPEPKLAAILDVLRVSVPEDRWSRVATLKELPLAVEHYLQRRLAAGASPIGSRARTVRRFIDGLFSLRGKDGYGGSAETESLQFFAGSWNDPSVKTNPDLVSYLLDDAKTAATEQGRLTRLWIAFRELSGSPPDHVDSQELLPLWDRFLGEWSAAGSWYGLHGHPNLAVLPALVNQASIRNKMKALGSADWKDHDVSYPGGALASARYSIARRAGLRPRRFLLNAALADVSRSLNEDSLNPANRLLIRGSIFRQKGALWTAAKDYEDAVAWFSKHGGSDQEVGVALSELGFGRLFQLRPWTGVSLMEEGMALLNNSEVRAGFLIRAQRKLAIGYVLTGRLREARAMTANARQSATENMALDQLRRL